MPEPFCDTAQEVDLVPGLFLPIGTGGTWWRVLDVDRQTMTALLISERGFLIPYHDSLRDITWQDCTLRARLNGEFLQDSFTEAEQAAIAGSRLINSRNAQYGTSGGRDTTDRIFLLSIDEAARYFRDDDDRVLTDRHYVSWWLRSPGCRQSQAAAVSADGTISIAGVPVDHDAVCIRPAFRLDLTAGLFPCRVLPGEPESIKLRVPQVFVRGTEAISAPSDAEELIVPEGVTELAEGCFMQMKRLRSVSLPQTLKVIGPDAFSGCIRLKNMIIPDGVAEICAGAFNTGRPIQLEMSVNCPRWEPYRDLGVSFSLLRVSGSSISFRGDHGRIAAKVILFYDDESEMKQNSARLALSTAGGKFDFARYDSFVLMLKRAPNKLRAVLARLEYPYELPAETREKYCEYLRRQSMNVGRMLIGEDRAETLRMLCEKPLLRIDAIRKLIDLAGTQGKGEAAAILLDCYNRCSDTADPTDALSLD